MSNKWRWVERGILLAGLLAVDVWIWSNATTTVSQMWMEHVFERQLHIAPPTPAESRAAAVHTRSLVGRLTIPRLHLSAMVREGADEGTLQLALGHIPGTAFPGQPGNVGVAGHRDTLFRPLRDIRNSDLIRFETGNGSYMYRVESTTIVKPRDVGVLARGPSDELTLVTCYPFHYIGSAPDRFIVKARQVQQPHPVLAGG
jgi:sortase A